MAQPSFYCLSYKWGVDGYVVEPFQYDLRPKEAVFDDKRHSWRTLEPELVVVREGTRMLPVLEDRTNLVSGRLRELFLDGKLGDVMPRPVTLFARGGRKVLTTELSKIKGFVECGKTIGAEGSYFGVNAEGKSQGLKGDWSQWSGRLVFRLEDWPQLIYSERAIDIITKAKIDDLVIEEVSQVRTFSNAYFKSLGWH